MSRLRVAVIVEGEGEVAAVPILLQNLWYELGGQYIDILRPPIRRKRSDFEKQEALGRAIGLAANKLKHAPPTEDPALVLILFDRDKSPPPCQLGPQVLRWGKAAYGHLNLSCVVANIEYETWFVACAEYLTKFLLLREGEAVPAAPEEQGCGKGWIEARFRGVKYSETQDQPKMTAAMNLALARQRSPSFDKLCRELIQRIEPAR